MLKSHIGKSLREGNLQPEVQVSRQVEQLAVVGLRVEYRVDSGILTYFHYRIVDRCFSAGIQQMKPYRNAPRQHSRRGDLRHHVFKGPISAEQADLRLISASAERSGKTLRPLNIVSADLFPVHFIGKGIGQIQASAPEDRIHRGCFALGGTGNPQGRIFSPECNHPVQTIVFDLQVAERGVNGQHHVFVKAHNAVHRLVRETRHLQVYTAAAAVPDKPDEVLIVPIVENPIFDSGLFKNAAEMTDRNHDAGCIAQFLKKYA